MAFDTFLRIDGITNPESDGVQIYSFSWGASEQIAQGSGHATGKVSISDLNVMKRTDSTSPKLFQACVTGKHFHKAELVCVKADSDKQQVFYRLTLGDVIVQSLQHSGSSGGDDTPTESLSLNFSKIEFVFTEQGR